MCEISKFQFHEIHVLVGLLVDVQLSRQWRNFGSVRPLAKNASQDGAPLKIFTDLPLSNFGRKPPWKTQIRARVSDDSMAGAQ